MMDNRWPIGVNSVAQTILDAQVLAHNLALEPWVETAIQRYDEQRHDANATIATADPLASKASFL
jgi:hypothetical protein